jgi:hypothetical protein
MSEPLEGQLILNLVHPNLPHLISRMDCSEFQDASFQPTWRSRGHFLTKLWPCSVFVAFSAKIFEGAAWCTKFSTKSTLITVRLQVYRLGRPLGRRNFIYGLW